MTSKPITYKGKTYKSMKEMESLTGIPIYKIKNWIKNGRKAETITTEPQGKWYFGNRDHMYQIGTLDNRANKIVHYQDCTALEEEIPMSNETIQREISKIVRMLNQEHQLGIKNWIVVVELRKKMLSWELDLMQDGRYTNLKDFAIQINNEIAPAVKKYIDGLTK